MAIADRNMPLKALACCYFSTRTFEMFLSMFLYVPCEAQETVSYFGSNQAYFNEIMAADKENWKVVRNGNNRQKHAVESSTACCYLKFFLNGVNKSFALQMCRLG